LTIELAPEFPTFTAAVRDLKGKVSLWRVPAEDYADALSSVAAEFQKSQTTPKVILVNVIPREGST